jgi:hypothetical protein
MDYELRREVREEIRTEIERARLTAHMQTVQVVLGLFWAAGIAALLATQL